MAKKLKYNSILAEFSASVFPEKEQRLIRDLGRALYQSGSIKDLLVKYRSALKCISPSSHHFAVMEIQHLAGLWGSGAVYPRESWLHHLWPYSASNQKRHFERHRKTEDDLCFLLMFHRDGYIRERALASVNTSLESAFEVVALAGLLNNWVYQVRKAAVKALRRSYQRTSPSVLASAFYQLMDRSASWQRWESEISNLLETTMTSDEVMAALAQQLIIDHEEHGAKAISLALRNDAIDPYLERIWSNSKNASVRAIVLRALLNRRASWKIGYKWQWVNKPLGERKRIIVQDYRVLTVNASRERLIVEAISDKAAHVRKVAAQAMIDYRSELSSLVSSITPSLISDRSAGVRSRAEFLMRTMPKSSDPQT